MADGSVGECTGQAGAVADCRLQLTAVAGHRLHGVQPGNVPGLGAGEHGAQCKESAGNMQPMLPPMPSAKRLGESMVPCHERSHQHASPKHKKLPLIEYAAVVQNMCGRHGKAGRRNQKASRRHGKASRRNQKASRRHGKASRRNQKASRRHGKASRRHGKASRRQQTELRCRQKAIKHHQHVVKRHQIAIRRH